MPTAPIPDDDDARAAALRRYRIIDAHDPQGDLETLSRLAAELTGAELALVNFIDSDRQVTAAATGMGTTVLPRDQALCSHTVAEARRLDTADMSTDERYRDNPFVTGELGSLRMYASAPIVDPDGWVLGTVCVADSHARQLDEGQLTALSDIAGQAMSLLRLRRQTGDLQEALVALDSIAHVDPLTTLVNRRTLGAAVDEAVREGGAGATLVFVDLDDFKSVNDGYGHEAGDVVLAAVAQRLREVVRPGDVVGRQGGDEFVVVAAAMPPEAIEAFLGRLRAGVEQPVTLADGTVLQVRASLGASSAVPGDDAVHALARADGSMYRDKRNRNGARGADIEEHVQLSELTSRSA